MQNTMKMLVSFFSLIFILTSCNHKKIHEERYPNGTVKLSYEEIDNNEGIPVKDGFFKEYYENDSIKLQGFYRMGKKDSLWISVGKNGKKKYELSFRNGVVHGSYKIWNNAGVLIGESEFVNGNNINLEGTWLVQFFDKIGQSLSGGIGLTWQFEKPNILKRKYDFDNVTSFVDAKFEFSDLLNQELVSGIKISGESPDNINGYEPFTYQIILMSKDEILLKDNTEGYLRLDKMYSDDTQDLDKTASVEDNIKNVSISKANEIWYYYKNAKSYVPGSICYKKDSANCDKYGRLYNWQQAQKACTGAWRLPTSYELVALLSKYGDIAYTGDNQSLSSLFGNSSQSSDSLTYRKMLNDKKMNLPILNFNNNTEESNYRTLFWTNTNTLYGAYAVYWNGNTEGNGNVYFSDYPREYYGFCRCVRK